LKNKTTSIDARTGLDRRTVMKGAAWSIPVIALAVATPAYAASIVDVGAFTLRGTCSPPSTSGSGFWLTSAIQPLPAGTTVTITGTGVADIGVFSVSGGTASTAVLSPTSRQITLTSALPVASAMAFRTTLSTSVSFQLDAVATLPSGYSGTGAKTAGYVTNSKTQCVAN
jgi:hypothetical protein